MVTQNPRGVKRRGKSKSGCRTCKIRHVKCDQGRPACYRCVSSGRTCDGYGVWGGGGSFCYTHSSVDEAPAGAVMALAQSLRKAMPSIGSGRGCSESTDYFEWFVYRTVVKFPGAFEQPFWGKLVFQAGAQEPAVLHALLALSSAHKRESLDDVKSTSELGNQLDHRQRYMLQHYIDAIRHLQPHFEDKSRESLRVALITCALFTFLEFFLGHYRAATAHLQNGLKLLADHAKDTPCSGGAAIVLKPSSDYVDDWIVDIFSLLYVQVALMGQGSSFDWVVCPFRSRTVPTRFDSVTQASQHLDRLLCKIIHLNEQSCLLEDSAKTEDGPALLISQRRLKAELDLWLDAFNRSRSAGFSHNVDRNTFCCRMMRAYYTLANIMIRACLVSTSEMRFDDHTDDFAALIAQAIDIRQAARNLPIFHLSSDFHLQICTSVGDKGWMPLLFYTAVKCRNHRLRLQAVKLILSLPFSHKEGVWDGAMTVFVMRRVMELEERDFYDDLDTHDDFAYDSVPDDERELARLPTLPNSYRFHEVRIELPEHDMGRVTLTCKRRLPNLGTEIITDEYDPISQRWVLRDGGADKPGIGDENVYRRPTERPIFTTTERHGFHQFRITDETRGSGHW